MEFEILDEILNNMPVLPYGAKSYARNFSYGSTADLINYLASNKKVKTKNTYPLIWLQTPVTFRRENGFAHADVSFVVATLSNSELSNKARIEKSFKPLILPTCEDVLKYINHDPRGMADRSELGLRYFFNYDNDDTIGSTDVWDAIQLTFKLRLNLNC